MIKEVSFQLPALPKAYWWGNDDPQIVQERIPRLEVFVQQLLAQPEILSDGEELLMRFLNMPKAASAAIRFVLHTTQQWLQRLYETTAEPDGIRVLKESQLEASLVMVLEAENCSESKRLACELLARRFRSGGETESISSSFRSCQVKVLLSLLNTVEEPERVMPPEVRTSARKALLTMACDSRSSWSAVLLDFLDEGMSQLLDASKRSGDEGQRLVVELLLRGFEGAVVRRFAQPEMVTERKSLLNQLFMSSDGFVRVTVGLLLAALLTDAESYGEVPQAEAGLAALRQDMFPTGQSSLEGDLRRLLTEEESWHFLFHLAASHSIGGASNFALWIMLSLVQSPQMILETQGLHELLVETLTDPTRYRHQLRGMAAKQLLELYRDVPQIPSEAADADLLGRAVASSAMEAFSLQEAKLQSVTSGSQEALGRHQVASSLEKSLTLTAQSCEALRSEAQTWHEAMASGSKAAMEAMACDSKAKEGLETFASKLDGACKLHLPGEEEGTTGGTAESGAAALGAAFLRPSQAELLSSCGPGDVARAQAELDQLMQARRDLGVKLSEQQEALQRITSELESSKSSLAKDAGAAIRAAECQSQREALLQDIQIGQQKADHLDWQMREACEALSIYKATLEAKRSMAPNKPMTKGMQAWMSVCDAQEECEQQLNGALTSLKTAAESLKEETRCRRRLRQTVQELAQRLMALDEELELLQQQDVGMEEDAEIDSKRLVFSPAMLAPLRPLRPSCSQRLAACSSVGAEKIQEPWRSFASHPFYARGLPAAVCTAAATGRAVKAIGVSET
eukprot:symbB.v1.2.011553.t1/scaffold743.1/size212950/8